MIAPVYEETEVPYACGHRLRVAIRCEWTLAVERVLAQIRRETAADVCDDCKRSKPCDCPD